MAILEFLSVALLASGAAGKANPDLCTTDPAAVVRPEATGVTADYALMVPPKSVDRLRPFLAGLDSQRFRLSAVVEIPRNQLIFVETRIPATTAEEVRADVETLCGFRKYVQGTLTLHDRLNASERAWRAPPKPPVVYGAVPPVASEAPPARVTREEIDLVVRTDTYLRRNFLDVPDQSLKLGPVRELMCRGVEGGRTHDCRVRLPIIKQGEPRYAEFRARFLRDTDGTVRMLEILAKAQTTEERPPVPADAPDVTNRAD